MIRISASLRLAAAAAFALAASAVAGPSSALLDVPFFDYVYYGDAAHTTVVGYESGTCFNGEAAVHPLVGTSSPYYDQIRAGVCRGDQIIYE